MSALQSWLAMDGYAAFVWPAWLLTTLGLAGLVAAAVRERRRALERLERLQALEAEAMKDARP